MLESNEPDDELLIQRSKSYDARLNYVYDTPLYYSNNNNSSSSNLNTNQSDANQDNSETAKQLDLASQTQIIVTSFAPDPKTKNLVRTTVQTRPVSQQFSIKNEDTVQITTSTSNMKSNNSTPTQMHTNKKQLEEMAQQD